MDTKLETTSLPLARKLKGVETAEILAKEFGENRDNIYRYIRLTNLISELLEMLDNKRIAFRPAVEISYLKEDEQYTLLDFIQCSEATPSLAQAIHLKKLSQEDKLTVEKMDEIMLQQKANQKDKYKITYDKFTKYIPRNVVTPKEVEEHLLKCAIACDKYGIKSTKVYCSSSFRYDNSTAGLNAIRLLSTISKSSRIRSVKRIYL